MTGRDRDQERSSGQRWHNNDSAATETTDFPNMIFYSFLNVVICLFWASALCSRNTPALLSQAYKLALASPLCFKLVLYLYTYLHTHNKNTYVPAAKKQTKIECQYTYHCVNSYYTKAESWYSSSGFWVWLNKEYSRRMYLCQWKYLERFGKVSKCVFLYVFHLFNVVLKCMSRSSDLAFVIFLVSRHVTII